MCARSWSRLLIATCLFGAQIGLFPRLHAQLEPIENQHPTDRPPEGLHAELQIGDGTHTAFHPGELVPVTVRFSSTEHTKLWVSAEPCDGPQTYPTPVPPAQLQSRRAQQRAALHELDGCMGHGWGGDLDLATTPSTIPLLLNTNYLLDTPGSYPLVWKGEAFRAKNLTSNTVALTLLPRDPAWEAAELARIDALMDGPPEKRGNACTRLRYLGTDAAELDMANRLGESLDGRDLACDQAFSDALVNAQQRDAVLSVLERRMADPDETIPRNFLRTFALISLYHAHPDWYAAALTQTNTPLAEIQSTDRVGPIWQPELLRDEILRYAAVLLAALPSKNPDARAHCIQAILELPTYENTGPLPASFNSALQKEIPSVFGELDGLDQQAVLGPLWTDLASPAMVPLLKNIFEHDGDPQTRARALWRIREFAPDLAQAEFTKEIANFHLPIDLLRAFPSGEVPALDPLLLQRATDQLREYNTPGPHAYGTDIAVLLLSRFASAAVEPQVASLLDGSAGALRCEERVDLLAYLNRVDPPAADRRIAAAQWTYSDCSIHEATQRFWSVKIQSLELAELDSNDPRRVSDALIDLQHNASASARPVILRHFRQWSAAYVPAKPQRSASGLFVANELAYQNTLLDEQYLRALIFAFGWRTTQNEIHQLGALCRSDPCRNEAKQRELSYSNEDTFIVLNHDADQGLPFNYGFAPYGNIGDLPRIEQKLREYPAGTTFRFDTREHSERVIQQVQDTLGAWITTNGYSLTLYRENP